MAVKVTILWGSFKRKTKDQKDVRLRQTYIFETVEEVQAFLLGVDQAILWANYEVVRELPPRSD